MTRVTSQRAAVLLAAWLAGCGQAAAGCGVASLYAPGSGARAASPNQMDISAAHRTLPPGTRVIVRNQQTGRSIIVRIADRSQSLLDRIIDLSTDAMSALGLNASAPVCVEVLSYGSPKTGFKLIEARHPVPDTKHAEVSQDESAGSGARSAYVRRWKAARLGRSKASRFAQARHSKRFVRKSGSRRRG